MYLQILEFKPGRNPLITAVSAIMALMVMTSCVSLDSETAGTVYAVEKVNGVSMLMDRAVDKHLALAVRNDSPVPKDVMIRPVGGDIGYDDGTSNSMMNFNPTGGYVKAAYILSGADFTLQPGEAKMVDIFLKNWHFTTRDFTTKVRVDVIENDVRHRIVFEVNQDDIFDDSRKMIQDNKMGRNDPSTYASVHIGVDSLPAAFTLTIPVSP